MKSVGGRLWEFFSVLVADRVVRSLNLRREFDDPSKASRKIKREYQFHVPFRSFHRFALVSV